MPDLSHEAALRYWFEFVDPIVYRVIVFMESVESWTLDGDRALEEALTQLGNALETIDNIDLNKLGHEEEFVQILSQIKTGRGLRLLQAMDVVYQGSASKILFYAQNNSKPNSASSFFLNRNLVFERLRLLSRIFAKERLNLIERALEGDV